MATFHSNSIDLNKVFYASQASLIKTVCRELDQDDKIDDLIKKLLNTSFTKIKGPKNPDKPKKPLTSYMFFCNDKREEIMTANPGKPIGEISKILGEMWKNISEKDREKYDEMNSKDKIRYEEAMEEFNKNN